VKTPSKKLITKAKEKNNYIPLPSRRIVARVSREDYLDAFYEMVKILVSRIDKQ
jgi:hypothetical protein